MKKWIPVCGIVIAFSTMAATNFFFDSRIAGNLTTVLESDGGGQQHIRIQNKSTAEVRLIGSNAC